MNLKPSLSIEGTDVILEHGAELPTEFCIKCGRPAVRIVHKSLRDPRKPRTWFGNRKRIPIGLSKKHHENRLIALTLTWPVLAIGILLLVTGAVTLSYLEVGIGAVLALASGVFRAASPVWSPENGEDRVVIRGTGEGFRRKLAGDADDASQRQRPETHGAPD